MSLGRPRRGRGRGHVRSSVWLRSEVVARELGLKPQCCSLVWTLCEEFAESLERFSITPRKRMLHLSSANRHELVPVVNGLDTAAAASCIRCSLCECDTPKPTLL